MTKLLGADLCAVVGHPVMLGVCVRCGHDYRLPVEISVVRELPISGLAVTEEKNDD